MAVQHKNQQQLRMEYGVLRIGGVLCKSLEYESGADAGAEALKLGLSVPSGKSRSRCLGAWSNGREIARKTSRPLGSNWVRATAASQNMDAFRVARAHAGHSFKRSASVHLFLFEWTGAAASHRLIMLVGVGVGLAIPPSVESVNSGASG